VEAARATARPNIVVTVADDLGYADLGIQGCQDIPTPNIAGQEWCRCTSGYVSCPVCSPTRAGLMTGRYQQRFGHEFNPGAPLGPSKEFGMLS
jgi:arylsulfatase A-like enzyme